MVHLTMRYILPYKTSAVNLASKMYINLILSGENHLVARTQQNGISSKHLCVRQDLNVVRSCFPLIIVSMGKKLPELPLRMQI